MKATIVGEGGRDGKKQQTVDTMVNEKWDNVQEIVWFFIEHSKKPDVTIKIGIDSAADVCNDRHLMTDF